MVSSLPSWLITWCQKWTLKLLSYYYQDELTQKTRTKTLWKHFRKFQELWTEIANKICLNVDKTEVVLLKSLKKQTDSDLHVKLNGKWLYPTDSVKYLGIIIDKNLNWHHQIRNVAAKLNRATAMLSKMLWILTLLNQFIMLFLNLT